MDLKTKLDLMKHTDSYWMLLPYEIKEVILKYKESQELIEWRESFASRILCRDIRAYEELRREWFIGPIRCIPYRRKRLYFYDFVGMRIYGHYWDLNGVKQQIFLHYNFGSAMMQCWHYKLAISYQTNEHVQLPFPEHGP